MEAQIGGGRGGRRPGDDADVLTLAVPVAPEGAVEPPLGPGAEARFGLRRRDADEAEIIEVQAAAAPTGAGDGHARRAAPDLTPPLTLDAEAALSAPSGSGQAPLGPGRDPAGGAASGPPLFPDTRLSAAALSARLGAVAARVAERWMGGVAAFSEDRAAASRAVAVRPVPEPRLRRQGGRQLSKGSLLTNHAAPGPAGSWDAAMAPSLEDLEALARAAFDRLPAAFRAPCADVAILVREFPDEAMLRDLGLESPYDLLGLYEGVDLTRASSLDAPTDLNRVFLFRRPLLDYWAEHEERLGHLVTHVLVHEIGHHLGLSDADMEAIEAAAR